MVNWQDRLNPQAGGAETHLHEVFGRLARWGHEVTLLASGFTGAKEKEVVDGISVHRVGGRMTFGVRAARFLRKTWRQDSFDVVVEDLNKVPVFLPLLTRTPLVLLVHHLFGTTAFQEASFPVATATWLLEKAIPWAYRGTPTVAVSPSTAEDLRARGLQGPEITVVPNGVDLHHFSPGLDGIRFPDPTILYLGRLKRYKRVDLILKAAARLQARIPGLQVLVAGKGDQERRLRVLSSKLGLGETVGFLGYVSEEEKVRLFRKTWVHVLTSPKEGWGISALESAACGTPTVASDSPGLRDAVKNGSTGTLVPHGDVEALEKALFRSLSSSDWRARMGKGARAFAEGFSWDESARKMISFLESRVAGSPAGG